MNIEITSIDPSDAIEKIVNEACKKASATENCTCYCMVMKEYCWEAIHCLEKIRSTRPQSKNSFVSVHPIDNFCNKPYIKEGTFVYFLCNLETVPYHGNSGEYLPLKNLSDFNIVYNINSKMCRNWFNVKMEMPYQIFSKCCGDNFDTRKLSIMLNNIFHLHYDNDGNEKEVMLCNFDEKMYERCYHCCVNDNMDSNAFSSTSFNRVTGLFNDINCIGFTDYDTNYNKIYINKGCPYYAEFLVSKLNEPKE